MVLKNATGKIGFDWLQFNYIEAGISRVRLEKWWAEHQRKDNERKRREEQYRKRREKKKAALGKLTKAERKLLDLREDEE
jgi:hypothetical protein